jgi:hypothetical protein
VTPVTPVTPMPALATLATVFTAIVTRNALVDVSHDASRSCSGHSPIKATKRPRAKLSIFDLIRAG